MSKSRPGRREVLTLALAALGGAAACAGSLPSANTLSLDQTIEITLTSEDGEPLKLPFPGTHTSVLSFWRPDCHQCRASLQSVLNRRHEIRTLGAQLIFVCVLKPGESVEAARDALSQWGMPERFAVDWGGAMMGRIGAPDEPALAILDEQGVLRWLAPGGATPTDVIRAIKKFSP
jgi:hypothetical protein